MGRSGPSQHVVGGPGREAEAVAAGDPELRSLFAPDFVVRSRAAAQWVDRGEPALRRLALVADAERQEGGPRRVAPVVVAILAALPDDRLVSVQQGSRSGAVRAAAAAEVARRDLWEAMPTLIEQLADHDQGARTAAVAALRTMASRGFDIGASQPPSTSTELVERERLWWRTEGARRVVREPAMGE